MYRVTQKSVSCGHPLMPPDAPLPLPTSPLSPPDIHISHLCCIQPIGVVHSAEVVRTVAIIYRGTYRGLSEWQMRVSAGHRFLRNPVHRSAAKMCRGGQCKNSMMSAGHRFTSLRGIIIVVYAIENGKSMSYGHLCFSISLSLHISATLRCTGLRRNRCPADTRSCLRMHPCSSRHPRSRLRIHPCRSRQLRSRLRIYISASNLQE